MKDFRILVPLLFATASAVVSCSDAPGSGDGTDGGATDAQVADTGSPRDGAMIADAGRDGEARDGSVDAGEDLDAPGSSDAAMGDAGPFMPMTVPVPDLPPPLPWTGATDGMGRPVLVDIGPAQILLDPASHTAGPVDAMADCLALVLACRIGGHSIDDCMFSAPQCTTSTPWEEPDCCPAACWPAYETMRLGGSTPNDALHEVVGGTPSCVPGLDDLTGGAL